MSLVLNQRMLLTQTSQVDINEDNTLAGDLLIHTFEFNPPEEIFSRYYYNYEHLEYEEFSKNNDFRLLPNHILEAYGRKSSDLNPVLQEGIIDIYGDDAYLIYSEEKEWKNNEQNYYSKHIKQDFSFTTPSELNKLNNMFISSQTGTSLMNNLKHVPNFFRLRIDNNDEGGFIYEDLRNNLDITEVFLLIKRTSPDPVSFQFDEEGTTQSIELNTWKFDISNIMSTEMEDETILEKKTYRGYLANRIELAISSAQGGADYTGRDRTEIDSTNDEMKSEIIGYKIEKITRGVIVQTYYVDKDLVDLNDTQYIFDQQYTYRITQIVIVFGVSGSAGESISSLTASTRIIEIPFKEIDFRAITWPIDSPYINVYTKGNENNRIDFIIEDREGTFLVNTSEMITVIDEDEEYTDKIINSPFYDDGKVKYSSRAATGRYQVFKLDRKPKNYTDFSQGYLGFIGEDDGFLSANFTDFVPYNQKFYYAFRSINHRGEPGNLSLIKELQLVQDADENILIQNDYDLEKPEDFSPSMDFRRFLRITPEIEHLLFKDEIGLASLNENDVVLGPTDKESLWEFKNQKKYFKLRLTNKTSGQKFDINLRFINKQSS